MRFVLAWRQLAAALSSSREWRRQSPVTLHGASFSIAYLQETRSKYGFDRRQLNSPNQVRRSVSETSEVSRTPTTAVVVAAILGPVSRSRSNQAASSTVKNVVV